MKLGDDMGESNDLTGLVFAAIFGSLFLLTCIISAIKAVRDRKRMKVRIAERERLKRERPAGKPDIEINNIEVPPLNSHTGISGRTTCAADVISTTADAAPEYSSLYPLDLRSSYNPINGIDNLNYAQSHADFEFADAELNESQTKPKQTARNAVVPEKRIPTKRAMSTDNIDPRKHVLNGTHNKHNISPECLSGQNQIRRNSYELAIYEHSWTTPEPCFASSQTIVNTYSHGNGTKRTSCVAFGNKAFDKSAVGLDNTGFDKDDRRQT